MTNKDIEITTVALMKSLIESGTPMEDLEKSTKEAARVFISVTNTWKGSNTK